MVHNHSLDAFYGLIESGEHTHQKVMVYKFILKNPCSNNFDVQKGLNMDKVTVRARITDLADLGVIQATLPDVVGGRKVNSYFVQTDPLKIDSNVKNRRIEKMQKCVERLINNFGDLLPEKLNEDLNTFFVYGNDM